MVGGPVPRTPDWDESADGWDENDAVRVYAMKAFSSLQRVLRSGVVALADARVIDFGCGTGLLTEHIVAAGGSVYAVDSSPAMLAILDDKVRKHGWSGVTTSTELPEAAADYDLIVCSSVCSFLDDYPAMVDELVLRLRPGGVFVQWDWERADDESHGLTRSEISEALIGAGLTDVSVTVGFSVTIEGETMHPLLGHGRLGPRLLTGL